MKMVTGSGGKMFFPVIVEWRSAPICNSSCEYCWVQRTHLDSLRAYRNNKSIISHYQTIAELLKQAGILWVRVAVGEPLLLKDKLGPLFEFLKEQKIGTSFITNATLPAQTATQLISKTDALVVSFDSIREDYTLSRKNQKERFVKFVSDCREINPEIIVHSNSVLTGQNVECLLETVDWMVEELGVSFAFINACSVRKLQPSRKELDTLQKKLETNSTYIRYSNIENVLGFHRKLKHLSRQNCGMAFSKLNLVEEIINKDKGDINADVFPCHFNLFAGQLGDYAASLLEQKVSLEDFLEYQNYFFSTIKNPIQKTGGFFSQCNWECVCGIEMIMNDVFWGKRNWNIFSHNQVLCQQIEERLAKNRELFLGMVKDWEKKAYISSHSLEKLNIDLDRNAWLEVDFHTSEERWNPILEETSKKILALKKAHGPVLFSDLCADHPPERLCPSCEELRRLWYWSEISAK